MMGSLPKRKHPRLKEYDYSSVGSYFITFCTKDKKYILSRVVGRAVLCPPGVHLTPIGKVVADCIERAHAVYPTVTIDKYVIMPNHVHILMTIHAAAPDGGQRTGRPTPQVIVHAVKNATARHFSKGLWQDSFYDHIIRDQLDYDTIWRYIDDNPAKWHLDQFYIPDGEDHP